MSEDNCWGLVPVKDWVWYLYKVTYHIKEGDPAVITDWCVSTDTHIESEVQERWPSDGIHWAVWDPVVEKVRAPRAVGSFYGQPISESGWEAGKREAQARGLK